MRQRLIFLMLLGTTLYTARAQYTLTGLKGLVNVPNAEVLADRSIMVGMHTNHQDYFLIDYGKERQEGSEYMTVVSIGFLKRLNIAMVLSRIYGDPKQTVGTVTSIGDRSLQLTYLLFQETKWIPAVVINLTDPLFSTNQYIAGNHLVASKKVLLGDNHQMTGTLGYGIPYLLNFAQQERRELIAKESEFLTGFFGGIQYRHVPTALYASLEYDGWHVNAGAGVVFWEKLSVQVYLQNLKRVGFGVNFNGVIR